MEWIVAAAETETFESWRTLGPLDRGRVLGGSLVDRNSRRSVRRLDAPNLPTLFVKVFEGRDHARRAERERERCERLRERGLNGPPWVALAVGNEVSFLALKAVGETDLDRRLERGFARAQDRRRFLDRLGTWLRRLHDAGLEHGQLFAWHVRVGDDDADPWVLDIADCRLAHGRASERARREDLAALFATISCRVLSQADRARLLAAYDPARAKSAWFLGRLRAAVERALRRGRAPRPEPAVEWREEPERVRVIEELAAVALPGGRSSVDRWCDPPGGTLLRERDGRKNWRIDRPPAGGRPWFGKSFGPPRLGSRLPRAVAEVRRIEAARWLGLDVPRVVLVARRHGGPSVFFTEAVAPGRSLLEVLRDGGRERERFLEDLEWIASRVRRLHRAGRVHRDAYLDHFLLDDAAPRGLSWIDWGRAGPSPWRRARIKDLAALEYSSRLAGVRGVDRLRWFRRYAGFGAVHTGPRRSLRRYVRWDELRRAVMARADRIEARERRRVHRAHGAEGEA